MVGEGDGEGGALAAFAFDVDMAVVQLHDFLHVAQSETVPLDIVDVAVWHTVEVVKNFGNGLHWDADALVGDGDNEIFLVRQCVDEDFRTAR